MKLHPFRALRPAADAAADLISPPYDVVSTEEARAFAEGNPRSFFHVIRPEIDLPEGTDPYDDAVYARGAAALGEFIDAGWLVPSPSPVLFVYRMAQGAHVQTGFAGCVAASDYRSGAIKRHELTRPAKEEDRLRLILRCEAQTGPVLLACRSSEALGRLLDDLTARPPEVSVVARDGVRHELWPVGDPAELARAEAAFAALDAFYIADGHHRAASGTRVAERLHAERGPGPWDRLLAVVFPEDQLRVIDYNRVVADLGAHDEASFLAAVAERFEVGPPGGEPRPAARHRFGMYLGGTWRQLVARPEIVDEDHPIRRLDVAILQDHLLGPILGIDDPRRDDRIDFVGGSRGVEALARRVDQAGGGVAFALYPTSLDELFAVADAGAIMPPKSTWFEPKLASGLMIHTFGDRSAG